MTVSPWLFTAVALYFASNLYFTGRYTDRLDGEVWWRQLLYHVGGILFFSGITVGVAVAHGIRGFLILFQVTFLFKLLVLGRFHDATPEQLEQFAMYFYPYNTLRGRVQRFCLALWKKKVDKRQSHSNAVA